MNDGGEEDDGGRKRAGDPFWEPPAGPIRAAGGLLGVVGGEIQGCVALGWSPPGNAPVAEAMVDLARAYVAQAGDDGNGVPIDVAERHVGATAPAWLLAVAMVRPAPCDLVADTLELATAAGVPRHALRACVAYVELAAGLFDGKPVESAIRSAVRTHVAVPDGDRSEPSLCGESIIDALAASVWALRQPGGVAEVMPTLSALSTPGVGAAVAGLLGLRDGCGALPPRWHRSSWRADECFALVPGLVRARGLGPPGQGGSLPSLARASLSRSSSRSSVLIEPTGSNVALDEAARENGSTGSPRPEDAGCGPARREGVGVGCDAGVGGGVASVVAAHAITEELEAIEERFPAEVADGVDEPTARGAAARPPHGGRVACGQRQLEGAGLR